MNNIILIGFMGSGKTSVGIRLSYKIKRSMIDTDKQIEKEAGKSISEIFEAEGEAVFRKMETACLEKQLLETESNIISTGGGLPLEKENRELLKKLGTVIYLKADANTIYERLQDDQTRPLLQTDNPKEKIRELLSDRAPIYEEAADIVIQVDGRDFEEVILEIMERTWEE